jgi:XRE family aerobic/anaerobic benzoate catabolism transcriptional regulator
MPTVSGRAPRSIDDAEARALLLGLGERVRAERRRIGLTMRELAEGSGISERFLVALEGGTANVSVLRLAEVARSLGTSAAELLGGAGDEAPSHALGARIAAHAPSKVALVGLRGAGKSSIGKQAAERLRMSFVELDERVAERAGLALGEIFDQHGPAYYRRLERDELDRWLADDTAGIVATSGGLVTDHVAYERLLAGATVVWLKASPEDHFARVVAQGDFRPMRDRKDAMKELRGILRARRALYERAHQVVDTSKLGLPRSIDRVVKLARSG